MLAIVLSTCNGNAGIWYRGLCRGRNIRFIASWHKTSPLALFWCLHVGQVQRLCQQDNLSILFGRWVTEVSALDSIHELAIMRFQQGTAGHELVMLAENFPGDREIIGIDLAEGMVDLANARCAEAGIRSVPGVASCLGCPLL